MTIQILNYYRITCDKGECPAYINVAAADGDHLARVLSSSKWSVSQCGRWFELWPTWCPAHKEISE